MEDNKHSDFIRLKQRLQSAADAVREKYAQNKKIYTASQQEFKTTNKQLIEPIKEAASHLQILSNQSSFKPTLKEEPYIKKSPLKRESTSSSDYEDSQPMEYLENVGYKPLHDIYAQILQNKDDPNIDDSVYGVKYDPVQDKWIFGKSVLKIDPSSSNITLKNKVYRGTPGLYNLLAYKNLKEGYFNLHEDLPNYLRMLKAAAVYRKQFNPHAEVDRDSFPTDNQKFDKYVVEEIENLPSISSATLRSKSAKKKGRGVSSRLYKKLNKKNVEYIYWDNVHELIDRLKLLIASNQAGNTSGENLNEIISIISELREEGIIA